MHSNPTSTIMPASTVFLPRASRSRPAEPATRPSMPKLMIVLGPLTDGTPEKCLKTIQTRSRTNAEASFQSTDGFRGTRRMTAEASRSEHAAPPRA